jgi:hypothetical protein
MLQWKAKYGMSDKAFEGMLKIVKDKLPENNELPSTTYEAKLPSGVGGSEDPCLP